MSWNVDFRGASREVREAYLSEKVAITKSLDDLVRTLDKLVRTGTCSAEVLEAYWNGTLSPDMTDFQLSKAQTKTAVIRVTKRMEDRVLAKFINSTTCKELQFAMLKYSQPTVYPHLSHSLQLELDKIQHDRMSQKDLLVFGITSREQLFNIFNSGETQFLEMWLIETSSSERGGTMKCCSCSNFITQKYCYMSANNDMFCEECKKVTLPDSKFMLRVPSSRAPLRLSTFIDLAILGMVNKLSLETVARSNDVSSNTEDGNGNTDGSSNTEDENSNTEYGRSNTDGSSSTEDESRTEDGSSNTEYGSSNTDASNRGRERWNSVTALSDSDSGTESSNGIESSDCLENYGSDVSGGALDDGESRGLSDVLPPSHWAIAQRYNYCRSVQLNKEDTYLNIEANSVSITGPLDEKADLVQEVRDYQRSILNFFNCKQSDQCGTKQTETSQLEVATNTSILQKIAQLLCDQCVVVQDSALASSTTLPSVQQFVLGLILNFDQPKSNRSAELISEILGAKLDNCDFLLPFLSKTLQLAKIDVPRLKRNLRIFLKFVSASFELNPEHLNRCCNTKVDSRSLFTFLENLPISEPLKQAIERCKTVLKWVSTAVWNFRFVENTSDAKHIAKFYKAIPGSDFDIKPLKRLYAESIVDQMQAHTITNSHPRAWVLRAAVEKYLDACGTLEPFVMRAIKQQSWSKVMVLNNPDIMEYWWNENVEYIAKAGIGVDVVSRKQRAATHIATWWRARHQVALSCTTTAAHNLGPMKSVESIHSPVETAVTESTSLSGMETTHSLSEESESSSGESHENEPESNSSSEESESSSDESHENDSESNSSSEESDEGRVPAAKFAYVCDLCRRTIYQRMYTCAYFFPDIHSYDLCHRCAVNDDLFELLPNNRRYPFLVINSAAAQRMILPEPSQIYHTCESKARRTLINKLIEHNVVNVMIPKMNGIPHPEIEPMEVRDAIAFMVCWRLAEPNKDHKDNDECVPLNRSTRCFSDVTTDSDSSDAAHRPWATKTRRCSGTSNETQNTSEADYNPIVEETGKLIVPPRFHDEVDENLSIERIGKRQNRMIAESFKHIVEQDVGGSLRKSWVVRFVQEMGICFNKSATNCVRLFHKNLHFTPEDFNYTDGLHLSTMQLLQEQVGSKFSFENVLEAHLREEHVSETELLKMLQTKLEGTSPQLHVNTNDNEDQQVLFDESVTRRMLAQAIQKSCFEFAKEVILHSDMDDESIIEALSAFAARVGGRFFSGRRFSIFRSLPVILQMKHSPFLFTWFRVVLPHFLALEGHPHMAARCDQCSVAFEVRYLSLRYVAQNTYDLCEECVQGVLQQDHVEQVDEQHAYNASVSDDNVWEAAFLVIPTDLHNGFIQVLFQILRSSTFKLDLAVLDTVRDLINLMQDQQLWPENMSFKVDKHESISNVSVNQAIMVKCLHDMFVSRRQIDWQRRTSSEKQELWKWIAAFVPDIESNLMFRTIMDVVSSTRKACVAYLLRFLRKAVPECKFNENQKLCILRSACTSSTLYEATALIQLDLKGIRQVLEVVLPNRAAKSNLRLKFYTERLNIVKTLLTKTKLVRRKVFKSEVEKYVENDSLINAVSKMSNSSYNSSSDSEPTNYLSPHDIDHPFDGYSSSSESSDGVGDEDLQTFPKSTSFRNKLVTRSRNKGEEALVRDKPFAWHEVDPGNLILCNFVNLDNVVDQKLLDFIMKSAKLDKHSVSNNVLLSALALRSIAILELCLKHNLFNFSSDATFDSNQYLHSLPDHLKCFHCGKEFLTEVYVWKCLSCPNVYDCGEHFDEQDATNLKFVSKETISTKSLAFDESLAENPKPSNIAEYVDRLCKVHETGSKWVLKRNWHVAGHRTQMVKVNLLLQLCFELAFSTHRMDFAETVVKIGGSSVVTTQSLYSEHFNKTNQKYWSGEFEVFAKQFHHQSPVIDSLMLISQPVNRLVDRPRLVALSPMARQFAGGYPDSMFGRVKKTMDRFGVGPLNYFLLQMCEESNWSTVHYLLSKQHRMRKTNLLFDGDTTLTSSSSPTDSAPQEPQRSFSQYTLIAALNIALSHLRYEEAYRDPENSKLMELGKRNTAGGSGNGSQSDDNDGDIQGSSSDNDSSSSSDNDSDTNSDNQSILRSRATMVDDELGIVERRRSSCSSTLLRLSTMEVASNPLFGNSPFDEGAREESKSLVANKPQRRSIVPRRFSLRKSIPRMKYKYLSDVAGKLISSLRSRNGLALSNPNDCHEKTAAVGNFDADEPDHEAEIGKKPNELGCSNQELGLLEDRNNTTSSDPENSKSSGKLSDKLRKHKGPTILYDVINLLLFQFLATCSIDNVLTLFVKNGPVHIPLVIKRLLEFRPFQPVDPGSMKKIAMMFIAQKCYCNAFVLHQWNPDMFLQAFSGPDRNPLIARALAAMTGAQDYQVGYFLACIGVQPGGGREQPDLRDVDLGYANYSQLRSICQFPSRLGYNKFVEWTDVQYFRRTSDYVVQRNKVLPVAALAFFYHSPGGNYLPTQIVREIFRMSWPENYTRLNLTRELTAKLKYGERVDTKTIRRFGQHYLFQEPMVHSDTSDNSDTSDTSDDSDTSDTSDDSA